MNIATACGGYPYLKKKKLATATAGLNFVTGGGG